MSDVVHIVLSAHHPKGHFHTLMLEGVAVATYAPSSTVEQHGVSGRASSDAQRLCAPLYVFRKSQAVPCCVSGSSGVVLMRTLHRQCDFGIGWHQDRVGHNCPCFRKRAPLALDTLAS